jgi:hypothetical protein
VDRLGLGGEPEDASQVLYGDLSSLRVLYAMWWRRTASGWGGFEDEAGRDEYEYEKNGGDGDGHSIPTMSRRSVIIHPTIPPRRGNDAPHGIKCIISPKRRQPASQRFIQLPAS